MPQAVQVEYLVSGIMHSGEPLASGQVYFYETDGTTAKTIWNDANKSSTASNPVTLDSNGKGEIFADGTYTVLIKTSAGSTIQTLENQYFFPNSGTVTTSEIDASSFGAATNSTISTAVTSASGADRTVYLNPGNWAISDNLTIPSNINLKFLMGSYVTVANTKTLTIQGTVEGPNYNIFRGDGTVTYDDRTNIIPSIWAIGGSHDNLSLDGTVTIKDNLIVNGTTTTINSTVVTIDDPIFTLGGDTAPGSDDNKDRGIEFRYHTGSAAKVGFFGYDDSAGKMTFIPDATNSSEVFSGAVGTIVANLEGDVTGTLQTAAQTNITSVGTLSSVSISGVSSFSDGSAASPSITNIGDTNTGILFPAADTVAISTGGTERLRVDSSSNVGIGTSTLINTTNFATLTVSNSVWGGQIQFSSAGGYLGDRVSGNTGLGYYAHSGYGHHFSVNGSTGDAMVINSSGNVGIGTSSPEVPLEINGGADGSVVLSGKSDGGTGNNRRFNLIAYSHGGGNNYGGGLKIQTRDTVNVFHDRMTVDSAGLISGDFNDTSDVKLKNNVRDFQNSLLILEKIKPRLFDWKDEEKGKDIYGFVAQELQEVMPTAVINSDSKSINVTAIVSLLVKSVQELKQELDLIKNG